MLGEPRSRLPHTAMIMSLAAEPERAPGFKNYLTETGLDQ